MNELNEKKIVYKIENDIDTQDVLATTYQMRNFYRQFTDGFFSTLDVMNYIQHQVIATKPKKGDVLVDVCCGRSLMLPLLRYQKKFPNISELIFLKKIFKKLKMARQEMEFMVNLLKI